MSGRAGSSSAAWLVARAADVLRTEGLPGVATAVAAHLSYLESRLYWHADYIIHVTNTADCAVGLTAPPVDGLEVHILANERDVERLSGDGYEDVRRVVRPAARRLQKGAVGFCAFVNRDVAHVEWVAFTEAARLAIDVSPCFADHGRGEASWGGAYTVRRFRNLGIFRHVMACALRYC
ncbi:MAG: hypothetical protein IMY84_00120, partial [Chloroflexi bacterium]|nr:hypothetical protein [Chloroflexota bacterium]